MNIKYIKLILFVQLFAIASHCYSQGMQRQLDNIFLEMENYTAPGSYETQRRSAYFGGRYTYKTQIFDENLLSLQLPSARGGCGGIDMFGGSFSFINSDQLVQLFRSVASNARGYAFQLAMDNMCSDCMKWMNELQSKMQKLNSYLGNSCQLAQGIMNDTWNFAGLKNKENEEISMVGTLQGIGEDVFGMKNSAETPTTQVNNADPTIIEERQGAVVFRALRKHSVQNWFVGGDEQLLETIMSMTGSTVVGPVEDGAQGEGETNEIWVLPATKVTMLDLLTGATDKRIYDCSLDTITENCMIRSDQTQNINIESLREKILEVLVGEPNGIITRIRNGDVNTEPNATQRNVLASMPNSIGSKIFQLAPISADAAEQLVLDSIDAITLEYIHRLVRESFKAVEIAMANEDNNYNAITRDQVKQAKEALQNEYMSLADRFGSLSDIEKHYNAIIKNARRVRYLSVESQSRRPE